MICITAFWGDRVDRCWDVGVSCAEDLGSSGMLVWCVVYCSNFTRKYSVRSLLEVSIGMYILPLLDFWNVWILSSIYTTLTIGVQ